MNQKTVLVPKGTFHSPVIPAATILYILTALAGVLSLFFLFSPNALSYVDADSPAGSIKLTWTIIHIGVIALTVPCAALIGWGVFHTIRGNVKNGMSLISRMADVMRLVITGIGCVALVLFVVRLVPYVGYYLSINGGIIPLFSGLLAEVILAAAACAIVLLLRKFFDSTGTCALSIAQTLTSGTLHYPSISITPANGLLILGLVSVYLAANRILTISTWTQYQIPTLSLMTLYCAAAMFLMGGIANLLLFAYLRRYKYKSEYLLFKGAPVDDTAAKENV